MPEIEEIKKDEIKNDMIEKQKAHIKEMDQSKVKDIAQQLEMKDRNSLHHYGSDLQNDLTSIANKTLDEAQSKDIKDIQTTLDDLLIKFDDADPDRLLPEEKGMFGRWLDKVTKSFEKKLGLLETTSVQIDKIAEQLKMNRDDLINDANNLDDMYKEASNLIDELQYYIQAGHYKVEQLENEELPRLQSEVQNDNKNAVQDIQNMNEFIEAIKQRTYNLELTQSVVLQSTVQLRAMSGLNHNLAQKIDSSIVTSIPLWRLNFATALASVKQRSANIVQEKVTEGTNIMLNKNAENISQNIVNGAEVINKPDIDIQRLRQGRDTIIKSIQKAQTITENSAKKREEDRLEFARFKQETLDIIDHLENQNQSLNDKE